MAVTTTRSGTVLDTEPLLRNVVKSAPRSVVLTSTTVQAAFTDPTSAISITKASFCTDAWIGALTVNVAGCPVRDEYDKLVAVNHEVDAVNAVSRT
jgi:hypothetical protein